jgi:hypothetical protein
MLSVLIGVLIICVVGALCFCKPSQAARGANLLGSNPSARAAASGGQLVLAAAYDDAVNFLPLRQ